MKNLLVTGGCGFIGSNFIRYTLNHETQCRIVNIDKLSYCSNVRWKTSDESIGYTFYQLDLCNTSEVIKIIKTHNVDSIIHFAAQTHVDKSYNDPDYQFIDDNVKATTSLMMACQSCRDQIEKIVIVSTDEVRGDNFDHMNIYEPTNPYSVTKACSEMMARAIGLSYGLPVIITRSNNIYGPCQYPDKIIPKFILQLSRGEPCSVHGDGSNRRSYLYVDDACSAYLMILNHGQVGRIYEMGCKRSFSNLEIAKMIIGLVKPDLNPEDYSSWITYVPDRPYNDREYYIDCSSLESLGWIPKTNWDTGLSKCIQWYGRHMDDGFWISNPKNDPCCRSKIEI